MQIAGMLDRRRRKTIVRARTSNTNGGHGQDSKKSLASSPGQTEDVG
ncbi:uncharacterized protein M6B38_409650 [Iris pallida]|uniref:Uncharacterized protein n=1 Tax=Iris pallida TaxID=29817 RepID=A0AAX6FN99_IRIPA|nr:uncharacterized protein M6B38_409650 [Iris pallida]